MKTRTFVFILTFVLAVLINTNSCATTPSLIKPAQKGKYSTIEKNIDKGANVNESDHEGRTPLMFASKNGDVEVVKLLIAEGADVNAMTGRVYEVHPIRGSDEAELLSLISLVQALEINNRTALMYASEYGHAEIVRLLIEAGADVHTKGWESRTALMYASGCGVMKASVKGDVECVRLLIEAGADVNAERNDGYTALMSASIGGDVECVQSLIEAGADVNVQNNDGETALTIVYTHGHTAVAELLKEAGAKEY